MALFSVHQRGNRVELRGGAETIWYEVGGTSLPELTDHGFAIWHLLPTAIREGFDIELDGPVSDELLENARTLARTWELWQPDRFREVRVRRIGGPPAPRPAGRAAEFSLFSGGVDSTSMLLRRGRRDERSSVLTVHGMDYDEENAAGFADLLRRIAPFLERQNYAQITVHSNARRIASGHHAWGFSVAGYAFLLGDLFERACLAADETWEIDMMLHPWGLNHATNRFFRGSGFAMERICDDMTRSQKIAVLADDPVALAGISFCKRRDIRPANCGLCNKCVRTKAMFRGMTGRIPPIFLSAELTPRLVRRSFGKSAIERANFRDLHIRSRALGPEHEVPGLGDLLERDRRRLARRSFRANFGREAWREWRRRRFGPAGDRRPG